MVCQAEFQEEGFKMSLVDHSIFTHRSNQGNNIVVVYVDDIIVGDNKDEIQRTNEKLRKQFT